MKPLSRITTFLAGTILFAVIGVTFTTAALIPTDTTPIPRPMPPGDDGYYPEEKYPKVYLTYDKSTPRDVTKAFSSVKKTVDWLSFSKNKVDGLFDDDQRSDTYRDKVPAYEFRTANDVLVADITKTALSEEELQSACTSLRNKLESQDVIFRTYLGTQSFTPVDMSDNVIFQIHDDMLTLFSKAVGAGKDHTLVSISNHKNESRSSIFANATQAAKSADVSRILVDNLDWRNFKILQALEVPNGASTVHLLIGKDGKLYGRLDKAEPTLDQLTEFIKAKLPAGQ